MEYIIYLVVGLIPALTAVAVVFVFLKRNNERVFAELNLQLRKERQQFFLAPRADAYQRIVLLLERIHPAGLIMRLHNSNKNATLFQTELLNNIRSEYDHNVAQQIFISDSVWELVKKSKEETIRIINVSAQQLTPEATSIDLCNKIFEIVGELEEAPTEIALKAVRQEFQKLF